MKKTYLLIGLALLAGLAAGWWLAEKDPAGETAEGGRKILYWVAPMDPNYRRDEPGKSPMGMDLIPVYEGDESQQKAGTVSISPQVENNLGVRTAQVQRGTVTTFVETVGLVRLDEDKLHHEHTRLSGWVQKSWVRAEGDRVRKGQPLVEIYSPELIKAQQELVAALESGNQTLIDATRERLSSLGIPADQVRRVEETRSASETIVLYAGASGYVDQLGVRDGMYITEATALLSVGPLETVWVEGELFPKQGGQVQVGHKATIQGDFAPGRSWTGTLTQVLPKLDEETRTLRVRLAVDNPDKALRPGMFVRVQLDGARVDALTVPRTALIRTGDMDRVVLSEGDGRYRSVRVLAGREFGERVEILQGLEEGARVVVSAQFLLDSESSVSADLSRIEGTRVQTAPWATAQVLSMPDDNHYARVDHGPVPEWGWPEMRMGFHVLEAAQADMRRALQGKLTVEVQLRERPDGKYEIIAVRPVSRGEQP
ncbi:efflux RND transporter periplasmic adaptor subunit [Biformimicrobium ophioploci]|nr:efflux RND transporter periplasmic adaptor subunit [Microbulbifer sp. NKW57]